MILTSNAQGQARHFDMSVYPSTWQVKEGGWHIWDPPEQLGKTLSQNKIFKWLGMYVVQCLPRTCYHGYLVQFSQTKNGAGQTSDHRTRQKSLCQPPKVIKLNCSVFSYVKPLLLLIQVWWPFKYNKIQQIWAVYMTLIWKLWGTGIMIKPGHGTSCDNSTIPLMARNKGNIFWWMYKMTNLF